MKHIVIIFLLGTFTFLGQSKIDRDLGDFSRVAVYDGINLELVKSDENKVEITKNIIDKTALTIQSKEKNSLDRIKQIELSAVQSIKNQASIELNKLIINYFSEISEDSKAKILNKSIIDLKTIN